jgi:hypothetical protein
VSQFNAFAVETYADSPTQTFIRNMRLWMQDFAQMNALLAGEEFKDYHFELFIDMALDDWAVTPPLLRRYGAVEDFPSKYLLMLCVAVIALESAAMLYARNNLNYSDGGITVATSDKAPVYLAIADRFRARYDQMKLRWLMSVNAEQAYGGAHSEYVLQGFVSGYAAGSLDGYALIRSGFFAS